jgi:hypothetical protein
MIMDDGDNLIVGDPVDPCEAETAVTADPLIDEANQGADVIRVGGLDIALSRDATELQISADGFLTHTTSSVPAYVGAAFGAAGDLLGRYVLVHGDTGVGCYDTVAGTWRDVTGDLSLGAGSINGDYAHIAGS